MVLEGARSLALPTDGAWRYDGGGEARTTTLPRLKVSGGLFDPGRKGALGTDVG